MNDDEVVSLIQQVLRDRSCPDLPEQLTQEGQVVELYNDLVHLRARLLEFSRGDFSGEVQIRGIIASSLKSLQANLKHLTWQVQQVASGDFSQRVEFMGDFSQAFNKMVVQLEESTNTLSFRATHDKLTGLPNRYLLEDRLEMHLAQARRNHTSFILVALDLDGFKPVNDTYGHAAGDVLLIEFGKKIRSCLRDTDTISRLGGDEFVFIYDCQRGNEPIAAKTVMERLYKAFREPVALSDSIKHTIHSSAGLSVYPLDTNNIKQLFENADAALYESKKRGKNRYTIWSEMSEHAKQMRGST
ncbi:MAG: diguanylate cyclase domain-containing protein [Thermoguttaceae bacterium]